MLAEFPIVKPGAWTAFSSSLGNREPRQSIPSGIAGSSRKFLKRKFGRKGHSIKAYCTKCSNYQKVQSISQCDSISNLVSNVVSSNIKYVWFGPLRVIFESVPHIDWSRNIKRAIIGSQMPLSP